MLKPHAPKAEDGTQAAKGTVTSTRGNLTLVLRIQGPFAHLSAPAEALLEAPHPWACKEV